MGAVTMLAVLGSVSAYSVVCPTTGSAFEVTNASAPCSVDTYADGPVSFEEWERQFTATFADDAEREQHRVHYEWVRQHKVTVPKEAVWKFEKTLKLIDKAGSSSSSATASKVANDVRSAQVSPV